MVSLKNKLFRPKGLVDDAYEFGIILKALGGLVESVAGIALLFTTPLQIHQLVVSLTQAELLEDPHDVLFSHLSAWSAHLGSHATLYGSIYLLSHGVLKIIVVVALLFKQRWAYPAALVVFSGFAVYQFYLTVVYHSAAMALLTVYDLVIIWLVWIEYWKAKKLPGIEDDSSTKRSEEVGGSH